APRPTPHAPRPYHFPRFHRHALANGIRLIVAPLTKAPLVSITALVEAGATADPIGRSGLAQLAARLLLEGTEQLDGAALAERFERLGASVDAHADWDIAILSVTALTERIDEAFALVGEVLRTPSFPEREVERLKAERVADLLQLRTEPRGLADEAFDRVVYEASSRFALPAGGTLDEVQAITRDDVRAFYDARYRPTGLTLVVAGEIDVDGALALAERVLGGWKGEQVAYVPVVDRPGSATRAVHLVAKSDAPQSELRIGHVGTSRRTPDYFAVVVMNAILGGLFSSRINLNLREAHGYTYGAFSGFDWRRQAGPFAVATAVKTEVTAEAVREVLHEIERMRSAPVDAAELSLAASYLDGVFPIRYETTEAIAAALANLVIYDMPDDWFDTYRAHVRGVTADAVLEAAQRYLHPDQLQIVAVGEPEAIRGPLEALGVGKVGDVTV
ncbi:MAG TPA: pitrilysin family protein, partial [Gemmatimonadaceae bacterium]|nr:pitrilysin family protein [Gemmatimonadaceae bacterium]